MVNHGLKGVFVINVGSDVHGEPRTSDFHEVMTYSCMVPCNGTESLQVANAIRPSKDCT